MEYSKIFVAGGSGFLGSRVVLGLKERGIGCISASKSSGVDFRDLRSLNEFFERERPDAMVNCAAYVGGIQFGMKHEGEIFFNNTLINTNLIECSRVHGVRKIVTPIANCSYPNVSDKILTESGWWDGPLHPSVMVYGFVKKATWMQTYAYNRQYGMNFTNFIVPNMYGPGDHFDEERSHALGALIMKIVRAKARNEKNVVVWGSGAPVRDWLYVDDCVEAIVRSLDITTSPDPINIGQGSGVSIKELAEKIKSAVGYGGELAYDKSKPDGAPYKVMDITRLRGLLKWAPPTPLDDGIRKTVAWYYSNVAARGV